MTRTGRSWTKSSAITAPRGSSVGKSSADAAPEPEPEPAPDTDEEDGEETAATPAVTDGAITRPSQLLEAVLAGGRKGLAISRYKGLGEMNAEQLWETTLDPDNRVLLQV